MFLGKGLIVLALWSVLQTQNAQAAVSVESVVKEVIRNSRIPEKHFGIWIRSEQGIYALNADQKMTPASLSKIPTALAYLDHFTMADTFKTWIYHTGSIEQNVLKGDLYLKGGGDPAFVAESLWLMVEEFRRSDIRKITGKIYLDESYFDSDYYSQGRQKRRVDRAYDAPVSALSYNWNSLSIFVRPGARRGDSARVYVNSDIPQIEVQNKATTSNQSKDSLTVERTLEGDKIILKVSGQIPVGMEEKAIYKSVGDPTLWTGYNFLHFLKKSGVEYSGTVEKKITPQNATLLVEHDGWETSRVVSALSKFSNNFVAEAITKHLGKKKDVPATIDEGLKSIVDYLRKQGWKDEEYIFVNPSGFTHDNKIRADRLGELLYNSQNNFKLSPEFLSSLPISGVDGTLKKRLRQVMTEKVRAKTGYMGGVVALGGYLDVVKGREPVAFVFFYNGPAKHDWDVRDHFDRILYRLYQEL